MMVTIRGISYATQAKAAQAIGVEPNTISRSMKAGKLETVGLGTKNAVPIRIGERNFPSITNAAKACGMSVNGVVYHLDRGTLDSLTKHLD